jgi:adenosylcobinamide amidohydrolase
MKKFFAMMVMMFAFNVPSFAQDLMTSTMLINTTLLLTTSTADDGKAAKKKNEDTAKIKAEVKVPAVATKKPEIGAFDIFMITLMVLTVVTFLLFVLSL